MREDGTTLSDEVHELYVYKVRGGTPVSAVLGFWFALASFILVAAILLHQPFMSPPPGVHPPV